MCDFKPGDDVVCVDARSYDPIRMPSPLKKGATYTIKSVHGTCWGLSCIPGDVGGGRVWVMLAGLRSDTISGGFAAPRFRKVIRRTDSLSIEAFLTIKPGQYEEPRRKERVRA